MIDVSLTITLIVFFIVTYYIISNEISFWGNGKDKEERHKRERKHV